MKRKILAVGMAVLLVGSLTSCSGGKDYKNAAKLLTEVKTTQFFTDEAIAQEDVEQILSAGVNAPSAMNTQPWHLTLMNIKKC